MGPASPYPILLSRSEAARALDVTTVLAKLVRKAMSAAARDDGFRARLLAFIPERLRPLLSSPAGPARLLLAADFHLSEGRMKAIELNFDVRVLVAGHESDIAIGPVYGRIWRGEKVDLSAPDAGVAPVYATA